MLIKLKFYNGVCDSTQDGVLGENIVMSLQPVILRRYYFKLYTFLLTMRKRFVWRWSHFCKLWYTEVVIRNWKDGVLGENIVMSLQPVRSDTSFKPWQILYKEFAYFGMKKSGEQRESTFTNSVTILKNITLLDPRNSTNSKKVRSYYHNCNSLPWHCAIRLKLWPYPAILEWNNLPQTLRQCKDHIATIVLIWAHEWAHIISPHDKMTHDILNK